MSVQKLERAPCPDVVKFLEEALAIAMRGETTGVLILEQKTAGALSYSVAGIADRYKVSGLLFHAIHKLQSDLP